MGVDGLNAVEHLRTLCPQTRTIWVVSDLNFCPRLPATRVQQILSLPELKGTEDFTAGLQLADSAARSDRTKHNKENGCEKEKHHPFCVKTPAGPVLF